MKKKSMLELHRLDAEQFKAVSKIPVTVVLVHGSIGLDQFSIEKDKKYALIFGNEVRGVAQEVVDASDCCIELPQLGTKHSLNIANTAAIVMWRLFEQLRLK